jgi:transposase-like protein
MSTPTVNLTPCHFRHLQWSLPETACDRCQHSAQRIGEANRTAIDLALDQPALLLVTVSVHHCSPCAHTFRAQPPFLRPDAIYSKRVVTAALASVYQDGMAIRRVAARLARDFWVHPSEATIRQWCKGYGAGLDFAGDYQAGVVSTFSGILCVDEVYQDRLALLLAVDPAGPDGDRLVGYQLVHGSVGQADVKDFLQRLRQAGIAPEQVITDGSALYPSTVAAVWPQAAHQLCLFHQTRHVTKAVREAIKELRAQVPALPADLRQDHATPQASAPTAVADDLLPAAEQRRGRGRCRREVRETGIALVHALRRQGATVQGIARQTGISRPTVRSWLGQPDPGERGNRTGQEQRPTPVRRLDVIVPPDPPPTPWQSWEQVRQVRRALGVDRFRLLCRPEHLTAEDQDSFARLFASPVGASVQLARSFLEEWYSIWQEHDGARPSVAEAQERYERWQTNRAYAGVSPLRKLQQQLNPGQFVQLSHFLRHPHWESTNNGAERGGRAFRHRQHPHFNLRSAAGIGTALEAEAVVRRAITIGRVGVDAARSVRGRRSRQVSGGSPE